MFKVGDKVRRKNGTSFSTGNHVDTVTEWPRGYNIPYAVWLSKADAWIHESDVELATDGPVRETTIVKKEIVPGVYGKVQVFGSGYISTELMLTKQELADAIKTLQTIHDAME